MKKSWRFHWFVQVKKAQVTGHLDDELEPLRTLRMLLW